MMNATLSLTCWAVETQAEMTRFAIEAPLLKAHRDVFGDELVGDVVFDLPYDSGFVDRHPHQLGGMLTNYLEAQE